MHLDIQEIRKGEKIFAIFSDNNLNILASPRGHAVLYHEVTRTDEILNGPAEIMSCTEYPVLFLMNETNFGSRQLSLRQ